MGGGGGGDSESDRYALGRLRCWWYRRRCVLFSLLMMAFLNYNSKLYGSAVFFMVDVIGVIIFIKLSETDPLNWYWEFPGFGNINLNQYKEFTLMYLVYVLF